MDQTSIFDRLDADQRQAVALRENGAVSAGAGSGKTTVLAARYLDLIFKEGADVSSILCLTFTRKAQAEMQARVYRELLASPLPEARAQVERFAEASISTIDSFCGSLLRGSVQDYGYAPNFKVDDDASVKLAEDEALSFLLERREEPALVELFARMGFERAWRQLFANAAYRFATPAPRPEGDFAAMPARAAAARGAAFRRSLAALDAAKADCFAALSEGEVSTARGKETAARMAALPELGGLGIEAAAEAARPIANISLQNFGRSATEVAVKEAVKRARESAQRIIDLERAEKGAILEAGVLGLLAEFAGIYRDAKRGAGIMGFHDVEVSTVDLLARRPELRAYWKRRYRYIMVDEFQDDNELQKELLYLLAEAESSSSPGLPPPEALAPDKLFFVGDDKQSIYRFRGADVAVFASLGGELGGHAPRLATNYRSEPGLLDFFNGLFSRVFAGAAADFEARFEEAKGREATAGVAPSIRLLWKPRQAAASSGEPRGEEALRSADEALADGLARFIKKSVEEGSFLLPSKAGEPRKAGYDDIAVLLRSTSKQYLLERFFRLHGIGYSADSLRGLFVESPANDIYSALRLALLPEDRVAYAAILRSPLVAISDEGFVLVLAAMEGPASSAVPGAGVAAAASASSMAPFSEAAEALLSAKDRLRFRRGRSLFEELCARADRMPLAELVSYLWYEAGLRLAILRRVDAHPYLEHYDYLFALAAKSDAAGEGLSDFLARLEPLMGSPEKVEDLNAQREAGSGVRIMSVHRSKGLEFPVVILPWIENSGQDDGAGEAYYLSSEAGLTLNLAPYDEPGAPRSNVFYEEARELDAAKKLAETKRLFYVACTRAEAHLVFAAVEPYRKDHKGASFLGLLAPGEAGPSGRPEGLPDAVAMTVLPELSEEAYRRLAGGKRPREMASMASAYEDAVPLERSFGQRRFTVTALTTLAWAKDPRASLAARYLPPTAVDEVLAKDGSRLETAFGTACHAVLEAIINGLPAELPDSLLEDFPKASRGAVRAEALRLALGFAQSELGRKALAFPRVEAEKAIILSLGDYSLSGRLDLFAESEAEILIIDFKSNRSSRAGEYDVQLSLYRKAAAAFAPGKDVRSYLFWLRSAEAEAVDAEPETRSIALLASLTAEASLTQDECNQDCWAESEEAWS